MFIKVEDTFLDHRKLRKLARITGMPMAHLRGHLVTLWLSALMHRPDGRLDDWDTDDIDYYCGFAELSQGHRGTSQGHDGTSQGHRGTSQGHDGTLWDKLETAGFIERDDQTWVIVDHDQYSHLVVAAEKREKERVRKAAQRQRKKEKAANVSQGHRGTSQGHRGTSRDVPPERERERDRERESQPEPASPSTPPVSDVKGLSKGFREAFREALPKPSEKPLRNQEQEQEQDQEQEQEQEQGASQPASLRTPQSSEDPPSDKAAGSAGSLTDIEKIKNDHELWGADIEPLLVAHGGVSVGAGAGSLGRLMALTPILGWEMRHAMGELPKARQRRNVGGYLASIIERLRRDGVQPPPDAEQGSPEWRKLCAEFAEDDKRPPAEFGSWEAYQEFVDRDEEQMRREKATWKNGMPYPIAPNMIEEDFLAGVDTWKAQ